MRLLDTSTLELKEFFGDELPAYAILSHRWEEEEVLFQDMINKTFASKKGFAKLAGACRRAYIEGHRYLWCDTTCIDKSSSAELSEAVSLPKSSRDSLPFPKLKRADPFGCRSTPCLPGMKDLLFVMPIFRMSLVMLVPIHLIWISFSERASGSR